MKITVTGQDGMALGADQQPAIKTGLERGSMTARERAVAAAMGQKVPTPANVTKMSDAKARALAKMGVEPASATEEQAEKAYHEGSQPEAQVAAEPAAELVEADAAEVSAAPVESKPADEPLSRKYAELVRKERELRQRELALKQREKAAKPAEEPKIEQPAFDPSAFISKEEMLKNPVAVMNRLGLTYDQLTEMVLNGPSEDQISMKNELAAMKAELAALKGESETTKKSIEERETASYNQAITQLKRETEILVKANPEFETIRETGSVEDVVELIELTYKEDGILMTVEEAAQQVEQFLVDEALKLAKLTKVQQMLAPKAAPTPKATEPKPTQIKTLSNATSTSRPMTNKERAMLAFKGEKF